MKHLFDVSESNTTDEIVTQLKEIAAKIKDNFGNSGGYSSSKLTPENFTAISKAKLEFIRANSSDIAATAFLLAIDFKDILPETEAKNFDVGKLYLAIVAKLLE